MGRSTNPKHYDARITEIINAVAENPSPDFLIDLAMDSQKQARNLRLDFYAVRRGLMDEAEQRGDLRLKLKLDAVTFYVPSSGEDTNVLTISKMKGGKTKTVNEQLDKALDTAFAALDRAVNVQPSAQPHPEPEAAPDQEELINKFYS